MDPIRDTDESTQIAARLRASRPTPREMFVVELERRLVGNADYRQVALRSRAVGALGLAGAIAATVTILSLTGAGPLSPEGEDAGAKRDCTVVRVERRERVPTIRSDRGGRLQLSFRTRRIKRIEERCR